MFGPKLEVFIGIMRVNTILFVAILALGLSMNFVAKAEEVLEASRVTHAKELLGKTYRKSAVKQSEQTEDLSVFINATTKRFLPKGKKSLNEKIGKAILEEADQYELDPVFLMAVIQNESSFRPNLVGKFGEIGLMQIKPDTAKWIAKRYDLPYQGPKALYDPVMNIRIGAALLDKLRRQFDSESRLYLSAYNIGAKKVRAMVSEKRTPKDYVMAVMKRYLAIYSAFKVKGTVETQSDIAFQATMAVTQN